MEDTERLNAQPLPTRNVDVVTSQTCSPSRGVAMLLVPVSDVAARVRLLLVPIVQQHDVRRLAVPCHVVLC